MAAVARKPRRAVSESTLVRAILGALKMKGIFCFRMNSGTQRATYKGKERFIKMGEAGTPDILLTYEKVIHTAMIEDGTTKTVAVAGVLAGIEVKTATGKLQPSQIAWHAQAEQDGIRVGVARSVSEALALVQKWSGRQ